MRSMHRQHGSIMPMVTIGMLAIFGLAALGLESGVLFWDKSRLQNAVDAAALSAAKVLDATIDTVQADAAGLATFNLNANGPGNKPLKDAVDGGLAPTFEYSTTLNPFVPGAVSGPYVRATAAGFERIGWFSQVFGVDSFDVSATAVAGPSPTLTRVCDIAPVMACADPTDTTFDIGAGDTTQWGYELNSEVILKLAANHDSDTTTPGNYFLIRIDDPGGDVVRGAFAGEFEACTDVDGTIDTEPGSEVGPVSQGVDTRFEPCGPPIDCDLDDDGNNDILPDMVVTPDITFSTYKAAYTAGTFDYTPPDGQANRRIIKVPMADCSGMGPGATEVDLVAIACFFLIAPVPSGGTAAELRGEFLGSTGCDAKGSSGPAPGAGPGPFKIILYKDPDGITS